MVATKAAAVTGPTLGIVHSFFICSSLEAIFSSCASTASTCLLSNSTTSFNGPTVSTSVGGSSTFSSLF
jgi:hypothetical protein